VGEVARFVQKVGGKSSRWVNEVLARYGKALATSPDLEQARRFVLQFIAGDT
jgi:hypothetical protein